MDVAKFCLEYADRGVVAIDVAGPIDHQSIESHLKAFEVILQTVIVVSVRENFYD